MVRLSAIRSIKAPKPLLGKPSDRLGSEWARVWKSCKRIAAPKDGGLTLRAGQFGKHRPEAVRYARHALSWQGLGSSRAAGGAALTISDVESGDLVSGLSIFPFAFSLNHFNGSPII